MSWRTAVVLVVVTALAGCWGGSRRPLFGGPDKVEPTESQKAALAQRQRQLDENREAAATSSSSPKSPAAPAGPPPDVAALLKELDSATGSERRAIVDKIVSRGEPARATVELALGETSFKSDVLREVLARLDAGARARGEKPATATTARKRSVDAPWVEEKYRLAVDKYLASDYLGCEHVLDAILSLEPDASQRAKVERLRRRAREQIVAETVANAKVSVGARVIGPRDVLAPVVKIENRSKEPIEIRAAKGAPLGEVDVEYEELAPDGTRAKRRVARPVKLDRDARLDPGASLEIPIELMSPAPHAEKTARVVARYRFYGRLRPQTLLAGEEPLPYFLRIQPVEVSVVDDDDKELGQEPRQKLDAAVASALEAKKQTKPPEVQEAARRAFVAACLLAQDDRDGAIDACASALEKSDGVLADALCSALSRATGEPASYSKAEWLAWWKGRAPRPGKGETKPAPDDDEEGK